MYQLFLHLHVCSMYEPHRSCVLQRFECSNSIKVHVCNGMISTWDYHIQVYYIYLQIMHTQKVATLCFQMSTNIYMAAMACKCPLFKVQSSKGPFLSFPINEGVYRERVVKKFVSFERSKESIYIHMYIQCKQLLM